MSPHPERNAPTVDPAAAAPARRAGWLVGRGVPIAALAAVGAAPFLGHAGIAAASPALLLASLACHRAGDVLARNAALVAALALASLLVPGNGWWAWPAPVILLVAVMLRPRWRGPDGILAWLRRGTLSGADLAWIAAVAAASAGALVAWKALRAPDVSDLVRGLPALPAWMILAGGTAWAAANAFGEEAIFRGALLDALDRALGTRAAFVVQALAFGLVHWHGFPRGVDGVALATSYGLMLGAIRRRTGGLLAPVLAHTVADAVILALLLAAR